MTKRDFSVDKDYNCQLGLKGPKFTVEHMQLICSNYPGGGPQAKGLIENLNRNGYVEQIEEAPAKPAYLPIKRKVRWDDLEDCCVLRYCGNDFFKRHQDLGMLIVGNLYTIRKDARGRITIPYTAPNTSGSGVAAGEWSGDNLFNDPWEFVSNPNYVHGFRIGETVYCMNDDGGDKFQKLTVRARQYPSRDTGPKWVACDGEFHGGLFHAGTLTRDPTKAYGYKAPVEYKVKDGVAKEGDVIWWLAARGDPERIVVGGDRWDKNKYNVKGYPNAYQLREPQKVWDYKNK